MKDNNVYPFLVKKDHVKDFKSSYENVDERTDGLKDTAACLAKSYKALGALVMIFQEDGTINIGAVGMSPTELREALNVAIHYSFEFEKSIAVDCGD